jgi:hypothetical protein
MPSFRVRQSTAHCRCCFDNHGCQPCHLKRRQQQGFHPHSEHGFARNQGGKYREPSVFDQAVERLLGSGEVLCFERFHRRIRNDHQDHQEFHDARREGVAWCHLPARKPCCHRLRRRQITFGEHHLDIRPGCCFSPNPADPVASDASPAENATAAGTTQVASGFGASVAVTSSSTAVRNGDALSFVVTIRRDGYVGGVRFAIGDAIPGVKFDLPYEVVEGSDASLFVTAGNTAKPGNYTIQLTVSTDTKTINVPIALTIA